MTDEQRAAMAARLPGIVTVEGRALSPFNCCLLAMQAPSVTMVGGFRQWINAGRAVRKGEHGMSIWVPKMPKDDPNRQGDESSSADEVHFLLGTVFDVSQTDEIETAQAA